LNAKQGEKEIFVDLAGAANKRAFIQSNQSPEGEQGLRI
tara:strand:- start:2055 stop:2171 length:117 start_codon:yes stop_codon:yes gene_type:complete